MKRVENESNFDLEKIKLELELEEVPAAVERKLRQVYAELPEEMPVRKKSAKPVLRRIGYAMSAVAAAVVLLFGTNAVNPAFAESIPGIGNLFAAMNNSMHPMGSHIGTYRDAAGQVNIPVEETTGSGYGLTVNEAFCDGRYVYTTMTMTTPAEAEKYESVAFSWDRSDWELLVDGQAAEEVSSGGDAAVDGQVMGFVWELPEEKENGQSVSISLGIKKLLGFYPNYKVENKLDEIPVDFRASYTVPVDTSQNQEAALSVEDNQVKLFSMESTPGYISFDMELPYWGLTGDQLLSGGTRKGYVELFTEDGQELRHNSNLCQYPFGADNSKEPVRGVWAFDGVPEQCQRVILRVQDFSSDSYSVVENKREEPVVFAEFTVDLNEGKAWPSTNYEQLGMKKADTEEYRNSIFHPDFTGGYLVQDLLYMNEDTLHGVPRPNLQVQVLSDAESERQVELRLYHDDRLLGVVKSHQPADFNDTVGEDGESLSGYLDEAGYFTRLTDEQAGEHLLFCCYYPEDVELDENGFVAAEDEITRIDLADSATGQVLIENLKIGSACTGE